LSQIEKKNGTSNNSTATKETVMYCGNELFRGIRGILCMSYTERDDWILHTLPR
jgi:hypothetical protein